MANEQQKKARQNGKVWEERCNKKFKEYRKSGKAYIIKIHNEIKVIRKGAKIVNAIFTDKSECLDFLGFTDDNKILIFECKSSSNKSSFAFSLIKDYQFDLNKELLGYTPYVFYLINMKELNEVYFVSAKQIQDFKDSNDRKSIPISYMRDNFDRCDDLDFLSIINEIDRGE